MKSIEVSSVRPAKWELSQVHVTDFKPRELLHSLQDAQMWSTAWCGIYWTLVNAYGRKTVDEVINDIFGAGS